MVEAGLKAYGYEPDPAVSEIFTKYRKSHNDGVFDAYTPDILAARRSGIVTGLPDAYGRGRIIGDYRRVALYGVDRLLERKQQEKDALAMPAFHRRRDPRRARSSPSRSAPSMSSWRWRRATGSTCADRPPPRTRRCSGLLRPTSQR